MINEIAAHIISTINASGLLASDETAERRIIPNMDIEAAETLQVPVITPAIARERKNREDFKNTFSVQIGLVKLLGSAEAAAVEPMIDLAEAALNLRFESVTDGSRKSAWLGSTSEPLYDADRLEQSHTFVSVITVNYVEFQS